MQRIRQIASYMWIIEKCECRELDIWHVTFIFSRDPIARPLPA